MNQNALPSSDCIERSLKPGEGKEEGEGEEEEEEEEEDVDFNPFFIKETLSDEASSSLSSEVDGLDGDVVNSGEVCGGTELPKLTTKEQTCTAVDSEHGEEEIILQSSGMISKPETNQEKHGDLTSANVGNGSRTGELSHTTQSRSPIIDIDSEDAICMRTRARYSLEGFSLDELETFLQETDDDDDPQNADDEEEYKKFLAAVLQGGDGDGLSSHENENPNDDDDDDEDSDADFELELEELLESDADENAGVIPRKDCDGAGRRPETRQNKRQKTSAHSESKRFGQVRRPLRPILPNWVNGPVPSGEATLSFQSSASGNGLVNGFTPQQIGQLYNLIHEHVQLLIQVFSLTVLEPSQKQIASQVQSLLFEMLHKRDEVLASKRAPYPSVCFTPPFACTSVSDGTSNFAPGQCNIESASTQDSQLACFPQSHQSTSEGLNEQRSCFQDTEGSFWFPFVRGPVHSILDVAPLNLVRRYVDDIYSAGQEFRKRYIESGYDSGIEKEPLFPFSSSVTGANSEFSSGAIMGENNIVSTSRGQKGQKRPKKTLAAMLVESTKKESIALVPEEVAKLTQRFFALFNPALFPHKPPPAAVVNRILFTDSEDELLALGILEYNTDWKAIQQRFLPCKSKHQIFVRQKNRCSSKALENPIKAVRRMKTSPLTSEEIACIQEGLKLYKFDWMSVWQCIVPHRDPSLLPRQWRIALGTQKASKKLDEAKREKRRLYESNRRKLKAAAPESWQAMPDKEDREAEVADGMHYSVVPYVHQAFLADWRPDASTLSYSERISSTSGERIPAHDANQPAFPFVSKFPQPFHSTSDFRSAMQGAPSATTPKPPVFYKTSSSKYCYRPYRARRVKNSAHLVKLAPDLPPVNLPSSVRVVSQTAFNGLQCGTSTICPPGDGLTVPGKDNSASQIPHGEKVGTVHPAKDARPMPKDSVTDSQLERSETAEGRSLVAEKGTYADLQMHPLLFQVTEVGNTPYCPFTFGSGTSSSFSFFSGRQPQLNLSLFSSSQQQGHIDCANNLLKSKNSTLRSGGIDFHPLLQKSNDTQSQSGSDAVQAESLVISGVPDTANKSYGPNEKSNELDLNLEIHLSSVSESESSRQLKAHDPIESQKTVVSSATAMKPQEFCAPYCQQGGRSPSPRSCDLASSAPFVVPGVNIAGYDVDDVGDQSHPEIVMEQEELSDSEEDTEEHVEFECEEMADSEGEDGSDCEEAPEFQNKDVPISSEENVARYTTFMEKPYEPRANSDTQVDPSLPKDSATPNMTLTSLGMDDMSSSSWLSLDSSRDNFVLSKTMLQGGTVDEDSATRRFIIGKTVTGEGHTIDIVQQPSLGPRKLRNRNGKSNANLDVGLTVGKSNHDGNHEDG